jgi:hypothetical protein
MDIMPTYQEAFESITEHLRSLGVLPETREYDAEMLAAIDKFACGYSVMWLITLSKDYSDPPQLAGNLGGMGERLVQNFNDHDQPSIIFEAYRSEGEALAQQLAYLGALGMRYAAWLEQNAGVPFGDAQCMTRTSERALERVKREGSLDAYRAGITPQSFVSPLMEELQQKPQK